MLLCLCCSFPGSAHALGCYVSLALPGHSSPAWWCCGTTSWDPTPDPEGFAALGSAALVTEVKEALLCPEECGGKLLCPPQHTQGWGSKGRVV